MYPKWHTAKLSVAKLESYNNPLIVKLFFLFINVVVSVTYLNLYYESDNYLWWKELRSVCHAYLVLVMGKSCWIRYHSSQGCVWQSPEHIELGWSYLALQIHGPVNVNTAIVIFFCNNIYFLLAYTFDLHCARRSFWFDHMITTKFITTLLV